MELNERVLADDYPVHWDYVYVADNKLIVSNIKGTVRDLKRDLKAKEIKSCDIEGRRKQMNQNRLKT